MHMIGLAVRNLQRKPFRTYALALAVAVGIGAVFATGTILWGVERSLAQGFSKFGADALVVPKGAVVNIKTALLTGEPSTFYMKGDYARQIGAMAGVAKVTPQLFLTTAAGSHCIVGNAFLVGFDPASDFTVMPWLYQKQEREFARGDVVVGSNNNYQVGDVVYFYGETFTVYGKLDRTGIGLYDNAIFLHIDQAYDLIDSSRKYADVPSMGFSRGDVSALLVQIGSTAKANLIRFAIAKNPDVRVVTAGNIVTSVRQNLTALFTGTIALTLVLILGNVLMISAIFSTIVNERKRELGLLRAIGARRLSIFNLVLSESVMLTTFGGLIGLGLGVILLRIFARSIGFHLESLNIPFLWPPLPHIALLALASVAFALLVGALGAVYPAIAGSRVEPYDAIRAGE